MYQAASKREELRRLLADARNVVTPESEPLLLKPKLRPILLQYLRHHSLREANQLALFKLNDTDLLAFFVAHWSLTSECEKMLFTVEFRPYLKPYIQRGCLADAGNEVLFFKQLGMTCMRRLYMSRYEFHSREAEVMLLAPEYESELRYYIEQKRHLFPDLVDILAADYPELYAQYTKYCPPSK